MKRDKIKEKLEKDILKETICQNCSCDYPFCTCGYGRWVILKDYTLEYIDEAIRETKKAERERIKKIIEEWYENLEKVECDEGYPIEKLCFRKDIIDLKKELEEEENEI